MPKDDERKVLSVRMNAETWRLLQAVAEKRGLSMTAVIILAIQEKAQREGVK